MRLPQNVRVLSVRCGGGRRGVRVRGHVRACVARVCVSVCVVVCVRVSAACIDCEGCM